jgi:hypothetical protein
LIPSWGFLPELAVSPELQRRELCKRIEGAAIAHEKGDDLVK